MLEVLDAAAVRRWADVAAARLGAAREHLDALNVYPVPDGDTGTNMHLTLEGGRAALRDVEDGAPLGQVSRALARGCLLAARGNSGIITAQLLQGWADVLDDQEVAGADLTRTALVRADQAAWTAVADPVEGTMLSATRAAAGSVDDGQPDLLTVVRDAAAAARDALERTPAQLPALAAAGVVDAGAAGVVLLLESLCAVVAEEPVERAAEEVVEGQPGPRGTGRARGEAPDAAACPVPGGHGNAADPAEEEDFGFEVMYLLDATEDAVGPLRTRLAGLGGSLVVVGGDGLWNVHVHTDDPGAAVEAGIETGRPYRVRITHLGDDVRRARRTQAHPAAGVVAFAAGPGLAALFEQAGAVAVRPKTAARASTAEVLDAVLATGARSVVVLPNDKETLAVAQAAVDLARQEGVQLTVLPTRAQVQGLAALAVHDPDRPPGDDVVAMSSAAGATRHGAVTVAAREAITSAGRCRPGDVLGVVDGDFAVIGDDLEDVAVDVLERLLSGGGELVTLVVGAEAPPRLPDAVQARVRARRGDVDVQVVDGGQERYPLLVGVE